MKLCQNQGFHPDKNCSAEQYQHQTGSLQPLRQSRERPKAPLQQTDAHQTHAHCTPDQEKLRAKAHEKHTDTVHDTDNGADCRQAEQKPLRAPPFLFCCLLLSRAFFLPLHGTLSCPFLHHPRPFRTAFAAFPLFLRPSLRRHNKGYGAGHCFEWFLCISISKRAGRLNRPLLMVFLRIRYKIMTFCCRIAFLQIHATMIPKEIFVRSRKHAL